MPKTKLTTIKYADFVALVEKTTADLEKAPDAEVAELLKSNVEAVKDQTSGRTPAADEVVAIQMVAKADVESRIAALEAKVAELDKKLASAATAGEGKKKAEEKAEEKAAETPKPEPTDDEESEADKKAAEEAAAKKAADEKAAEEKAAADKAAEEKAAAEKAEADKKVEKHGSEQWAPDLAGKRRSAKESMEHMRRGQAALPKADK